MSALFHLYLCGRNAAEWVICMKKKIIIVTSILIAIVLLCPIPMRLKDGGTVKYQALLYSVSDVYRLAPSTESGYEDGIVIEILGMQVFNNVN